MDMLDFVIHTKLMCQAHKLLMGEMADPERRDSFIAEMASSMEQPVEKVEELLDRLAGKCWIVYEAGKPVKQDTGLPLEHQVPHGNIAVTSPATGAGGRQSGRRHGVFDSIKFLAGIMECYGELITKRCRKECGEELQQGTGADNKES